MKSVPRWDNCSQSSKPLKLVNISREGGTVLVFAANDSWFLSSQDQHFIHCSVSLECWRATLSIDT